MKKFEYDFKSLYEFREYLVNNKNINKNIFLEPASLNKSDFGGNSYKTALEYLETGVDTTDFYDFLTQLKRLENTYKVQKSCEYTRKKSYYGSSVSIPDYLKGNPKCMYIRKKNYTKELIKIYVNLSYPWTINKSQVKNKGLATLALIKLLEDSGYLVDLNAYILCHESDFDREEIFHTNILLKALNQRIDINKCYFPFCRVEFFRRLIFRLQELTNFNIEEWGGSYGSVYNLEEEKEILGIDDNKILISNPRDLNIAGNDLYDDTKRMFKRLEIDRYIDVKKR